MKTKQEMLKIIIEKAIKNGYKPMENWEDFDKHSQKNWIKNNSLLVVHRVYSKEWLLLLFDHKFAEAYFRSGEWQFNLQQAVISEDPIKHYYENK